MQEVQEKSRQLAERLERVTGAPREIGEKIDQLKASPGGQKLTELDAKAGRLYARIGAAFWFALGLIVLAVGIIAAQFTDGWLQIAAYVVAGTAFLYATWCAMARLRQPPAASEILIAEMQEQVKPAMWVLRLLRGFSGRIGTTAD